MKIADKIFAVIVAISGLLIVTYVVLLFYIEIILNAPIGEAASIGIIGGADGPTAIFASGYTGNRSIVLSLFVVLAFLLPTGFLIVRKAQRKRRN